MSELKYSESKLPYIELTTEGTIDHSGDYGMLIFSRTTQTSDGYKYICYTHTYTDLVKVKKGSGYDMHKMTVKDSYIFNMKMKRDAEGIRGVPQGTIPRRLVDWIIAMFNPFLIDDVLPFSAIEQLRPIIEGMDIPTILDTKVKRAYKRKKKKDKVVPEPVKSTGTLTDLF